MVIHGIQFSRARHHGIHKAHRTFADSLVDLVTAGTFGMSINADQHGGKFEAADSKSPSAFQPWSTDDGVAGLLLPQWATRLIQCGYYG